MARPLLRGNHATLGLSLVLFTFMFLPTFLVLLAVVVFFVLAYPRLRKGARSADSVGDKDMD